MKIIRFLVFLFILNLFYPVWAKSYTDFSRPLLVMANDPSVSIELPDNPSTGYQWVLTSYDHDLVKPVGAERVKANAQQPGKPGLVIFKFKLQEEAFVVSQRFKINLEYLRPWETTAAKVLSIELITQRD